MNEEAGVLPKRRKLPILLIFASVIAAIIAILWLICLPREPSWQGKHLTAWLREAGDSNAPFDDQNNSEVIQCREAVRNIGTNAIPTLLRILKAKDSKLKRVAIDLVERQSVIKFNIHSAEERRMLAVIGFYYLGDLATNAVPALIELAKDSSSPNSKAIADQTLMRLYPAKSVAVPFWIPVAGRAEWYMDAGMLQGENGSSSNAVLAFTDAIALDPTNVAAHVSRANARMGLQDFTNALEDFEKALQLSPTNHSAISGRGLCKLALKDFKSAEADFTSALNIESNDFRALKYRGLARANLRDFDAALSDLTDALGLFSHDPELYRNRATIYAMQTEFELALADISKAIDLDKTEPASYALRARIHCSLKEYSAGLADAETALKLKADDLAALSARATARVLVDDFGGSAADLETILRLNPKNPNALLIRGVLRAKKGGEDAAALADFEQAVELAPQAPETHGFLGLFQYKLAKWDDALLHCRTALQLHPAPTSIASQIAIIWLIRAQSGQLEAANEELQTFLKSLDDTKTNEWKAIPARFLTGSLSEADFLNLATSAAKRPSAVIGQVCESLYYAAMKRKLAGDKQGALDLLQKCLDTKFDNSMEYLFAAAEMRVLKSPPQ